MTVYRNTLLPPEDLERCDKRRREKYDFLIDALGGVAGAHLVWSRHGLDVFFNGEPVELECRQSTTDFEFMYNGGFPNIRITRLPSKMKQLKALPDEGVDRQLYFLTTAEEGSYHKWILIGNKAIRNAWAKGHRE